MPLFDQSQFSETKSRLTPDTILQSRYRVLRHLGNGGMGAVYQAVDLRLGHTVALKQTLTADVELWKHFEQEARLLAQLNHPVLPRVTDYFTEGNRAFFVMQFIDGLDLAEIIAQQPGPFPQKAVIAWADQLLDALIYLHSHARQIIHRDIKPHNLKVTPTGQIALLDFGLAKSGGLNSHLESSHSVFGYTPRYAPLEQIQDLGTSPRSDIYALGATLYHLLTGIKPPDALTRAAALISAKSNPLRPANEINSAVGPELAAILSKAMAQNPDERYTSALEFREALRRVGRVDGPEIEYLVSNTPIDSLVVETGETTIVSRAPMSTTRRPGTHALAAVFVILLTVFGVFCRYYPWKLPPIAMQEFARQNSTAANPKWQMKNAK
ncbi:MAG: serine/threonine protein kinase [Acidobacteria bacterium]|nr:MAG: serine/threonine protein kinase [Acidobacteriota bacterium]